MKDVGMYAEAASLLRSGCARNASLNFMREHDGFEDGDWLILYE